MKNKKILKKTFVTGLAICCLTLVTGCVDQHASNLQQNANQTENNSQLEGTASQQQELRVAATSVAVVTICEKLEIPLVGVPESSLADTTTNHPEATIVGTPMAPDLEILTQLKPDYVLSPSSLMEDLKPKYEAAGLGYAFLNLKSVTGMYKSIQELGVILGREEQANEMVAEFETYYEAYKQGHAGKEGPRVLVLMGLPGSYVVATENSYVGSLVALAGGENVYAGTDKEFLNVNAEDMLQADPDLILRTAHAMPDEVMEMFAEEFETNDTWKHFRAVKEGHVYDLSNSLFGMSATFSYPEALEELDALFYE